MVRWIILAVLVVVVAAVVPLAVTYLPADVAGPVPAARSEEPGGPPPVVVLEDAPTHDFGLMSEQDNGSRTWVVRNKGDGPLRLRFIEKPCTCTGVRIGDDGRSMVEGEVFVVDPGSQTELVVDWETRDKIGEFSTFARFASNDYEHNPTLTLTVKGMIAPAVVVDPPRLDFSAVPSDEESSRSTVVFSPTRPEMTFTAEPKTSRPGILAAEARALTDEELERYNRNRASELVGHDHAEGDDGHEHPELDQMPKLTAGYLVTLRIKPGLPLGRFADAVTLKTDHPLRPQAEIPIAGQVVGPISMMPERVYLPGVSSRDGRMFPVTLNVRNHDETRFNARIPDELGDVVRVSIRPVEGIAPDARFRQYRMELLVPPGARPGSHKGTILLETDHPQAEEVKLPVELLVRGG